MEKLQVKYQEKVSFKGEGSIGIQGSINHGVLLLLSNLYRLGVRTVRIYLGMKQSELIISEFASFESILPL